jgi:hypothetical protein
MFPRLDTKYIHGSDAKTSDTDPDPDIKIIPYQTYRKISSTAPPPSANPETPKTTRPFRRGEKRLATMTPIWYRNISQENLANVNTQLAILRDLENQPNAPFLKSLVATKLKSYTEQDTKKKFAHDTGTTITVAETIDLLVASEMRCYYCQETAHFFYETVREPKQWTLERLNNEYPHTKDNVVIACLQCNLRRRCMNSERYRKTKQMTEVQKLGEELPGEEEEMPGGTV